MCAVPRFGVVALPLMSISVARTESTHKLAVVSHTLEVTASQMKTVSLQKHTPPLACDALLPSREPSVSASVPQVVLPDDHRLIIL